jgi:hypothetical protein
VEKEPAVHAPISTPDPRNRRRYLTEAATVIVVLAILLTSAWSRDLRQSWWLWLIVLAGFTWRAWLFRRDLLRYRRWHESRT